MKETIDEGMMQDVHDDTEYVRPQMEHGTQNISREAPRQLPQGLPS
jgi:hypothetical protein